MQALIRFGITALCFLLLVVPAGAQGVVSVNSASYVNPALPNGSIAQGSMFIGFGSGLGPATIAYPTPWPFPTELAGTTIQVTVGATTVDCFMVYSSAGQIAGILPSNTPLGAGTMTVRFNGAIAATGPITVVAHSFGIFTINQQGIGPAVATDPLALSAVYSTTASAAPGDFIDIWGTGLGAVTVPDQGSPVGGTVPGLDVKVYVANVEQPVLYAGRSGCCSAIDQVRIKAPNITGCFLPVVVVVNGIPSNYASLSIDPSGAACTPDPILGEPNFSQLTNGGTYSSGVIALSRGRSSIDIDFLGPQAVFDSISDTASGLYQKVTIQNVAAFAGNIGITRIGSCSLYRYTGEDSGVPELIPPTPLDAGAQLSIAGPGGNDVLPKVSPGSYRKSFGIPSFPLTPEAKQQFINRYFEPGLTTVTAPGGTDVAGHNAGIVIPQDFVWSNQPAANSVINKNVPKVIQYTATGYDLVTIIGGSSAEVGDTVVGVQFYCSADPQASSFSIPTPILQSLPSGTGALIVGGSVYDTFNAPSLDSGVINYSDTTVVVVGFN